VQTLKLLQKKIVEIVEKKIAENESAEISLHWSSEKAKQTKKLQAKPGSKKKTMTIQRIQIGRILQRTKNKKKKEN